MASRNGVDREQADAFAGDDRNIGKIVRDRLTVERPLDLYRLISLQNGTRCGDCLSPIRRFLTEYERRYLRSN